MNIPSVVVRGACILLACVAGLQAETGTAGWLRYALITDRSALVRDQALPAAVVALDHSETTVAAEHELIRGIRGMLSRTVREDTALPDEDAFVLGTADEMRRLFPDWTKPTLGSGGFSLSTIPRNGHSYLAIAGADDQGTLYGTFRVLDKLARLENVLSVNDTESPSAPIRWVNQWDNLDGSIERGYAGRSIFFSGGTVREDLTRAGEYARLLSSVSINGCTVNNVNADLRVLTSDFLNQAARIADVFRPWGVRLSLSVDLSSPKVVGGLDTFDPLDPRVAAWWQTKVDEIYRRIPDFGGFVVKADSEGRPGPSQYGRTPAEAANVLARALKPHGGVILYRGFVYNHHLDWRDLKADRARAGYDNFAYLDGKFEDNVIVQVKYGPIDFQVREPVSPLFAALQHTNQAVELQITQEYTGQQRHLVFLVPMWKETLDFDLHAHGANTPVKDIVTGKAFHRTSGGFVGVANVGLDTNWLHHPLAMANLYGFGRLAWNPNLSSKAIVDEWTRLTFNNNPNVVDTISNMQLSSWRIYENYTGPLGLGTLTDIIHVHYGPGIESAERNGWGQWIRADQQGVGMDRTVATGTGYIGQYPPAVASLYESLSSTPDNLLLFMHHVPYTYRLHSGKTVIQYIYDSHYQGAEKAAGLIQEWESLRGMIDDKRFAKVLELLRYQAGHAIVWRDAVCNWFFRMSGIRDTDGRVGHYPDRVEAETMQLTGYAPVDVTPWETASGGKAVACTNRPTCEASTRLERPAGWYNIAVQYFDQNNGVSTFQVFMNQQQIGAWSSNADLPSDKPNGHTSTRHVISQVALRPGDTLRIEGTPNGGEAAPVDYMAVEAATSHDAR
jgi:alpha-glucuronidase